MLTMGLVMLFLFVALSGGAVVLFVRVMDCLGSRCSGAVSFVEVKMMSFVRL